MAPTFTYSGNLNIAATLRSALAGDYSGGETAVLSFLKTFDSANVPIVGFLKGSPVCGAGDWEMVHATDPFGAMGDAEYSRGLTPGGKKLVLLAISNLDGTRTITVARASAQGLPIFSAADDAIPIGPLGCYLWCDPAGTAALTNDTNDHLTIAVSGGTPIAEVLAVYRS
jgi:hypothetical protein